MVKGFTIVEVIVVVAVLVILSTIASLSYGAWQKQLAINEANSDLLAAKAAMDSARNVASDGKYPSTVTITPSPKITLTGGGTSANTHFCIRAVSTRSIGVTYYITDTSAKPTTTACTYP